MINFVGAVAINYSLYRDAKSNLPMKNATRFLLSSKYRRLSFERSQRNSAAEWSTKVLTVSKCKMSRIESSGSVS